MVRQDALPPPSGAPLERWGRACPGDGSGTVAPTSEHRTGRGKCGHDLRSGVGPRRGATPRLPTGRRSLYPVVTLPGQVSSARHETQVMVGPRRGSTDPAPQVGEDTRRRRPGGLVVQEEHCEAHVSAQQPSARQAPRLPPPDVDPSGSRRAAVATAQGPSQVVGLIWRIRDRRTFLELRRSGRRARAGVLTVTFAPDPPASNDPPRVAFSVARRVGPAIRRNQIRRRVRSAMRAMMVDSPPMVPSGAYLISVRPEAVTRTYEELSNDLQTALAKLSRASRPGRADRSS